MHGRKQLHLKQRICWACDTKPDFNAPVCIRHNASAIHALAAPHMNIFAHTGNEVPEFVANHPRKRVVCPCTLGVPKTEGCRRRHALQFRGHNAAANAD